MEITIHNTKLEPDETDIVVTDGLHCGVEPLGGVILKYLEDHPIDGVVTYPAYPEAKAAGKRYLGSGELGSRFDLNVLRAKSFDEMDNDERAALRFLAELPDRYWLGIDPHTARSRNANCLVIGTEGVGPPVLGVAGVLGLRNVIVMPDYPFFDLFPKFASVETEHAPGRNPLSDPKVWREHLQTMHTLGVEAMNALGEEIMNDLHYYVEVELMRLDKNGRINPATCRMIRQLEEIEQDDAYFTPIPALPEYLKPLIREGQAIYTGHWNDNNNSPEMPKLLGYRSDGRPRRTCFGSFLLKISPPQLKKQSDIR